MLAIAVWIGLVLVFAILRQGASLFHAFDTGLYLQLAFGVWHYGSLASSIVQETNFLAHHFQPTFLVVSPIVALFPFPVTLATISAVSIALGFFLALPLSPQRERVFWCILLSFLLHPALAGSIWRNFTPEVLAFPVYVWLVRCYLQRRVLHPLWFLALLLWAGGCKETLLITNACIAGLFAWSFPERRLSYGIIALGQLAFFAALFFWWMPNHSMLGSYYGLSYYWSDGDGSLGEKVLTLVRNVLSWKTWDFGLFFFVCGGWLLVARPNWALLPCIPGFALILLSRHPQVKDIGNHYALSFLPFLLPVALHHRNDLARLLERMRSRLLPFAWVFSLIATLAHGGVLETANLMWKNPRSQYFRRDTRDFVEHHAAADKTLILDGILLPNVPEHQHTRTLLSFWGNPLRFTDADRRREFYVLTTEALHSLTDCQQVELTGGRMPVFYRDFFALCHALQQRGQQIASYAESGMYGYFVRASD